MKYIVGDIRYTAIFESMRVHLTCNFKIFQRQGKGHKHPLNGLTELFYFINGTLGYVLQRQQDGLGERRRVPPMGLSVGSSCSSGPQEAVTSPVP